MSDISEKEYAGFWVRGAALWADLTLLITLQWLVWWGFEKSLALWMTRANSRSSHELELLELLVALLVWLVPPALYFTLFGARGATPGKRLFKLRIVGADGAPPSRARAFLRWLASCISACPAGIGYLIAAAHSEKAALHDRLASTRVLRVGPSPVILVLAAYLAPLLLFLGLSVFTVRTFTALCATSNEGITRGSRNGLASAVSIYYGDAEGSYPPSLDGPEMIPKYTTVMPRAILPHRGHNPSTAVRLYPKLLKSPRDVDPALLSDSGGWMYEPKSGLVFVDCTHLDTHGREIYLWGSE